MTRTASRGAVLFLLASVVGYLVIGPLLAHRPIDLAVYSATGDAVTDHTAIYGPLGTPYQLRSTYPPFAALLFVPLADVSLRMLQHIALGCNLVLLALVAVLSTRVLGVARQQRLVTAMVLAGVSIWAEPVFTALRLGQVDLLLLALVLWDFARPDGARWRGVGIGLAAAIKIVPGVFVVYLLLTRRFREAATAVYTFVLALAIGSILLPVETKQYWTRLIFDSGRVGRVINEQNQSLRGLIARLRHSPHPGSPAIVAVFVVGVAGLLIAALAYRRLDDRWGIAACAVTALLATPIAWTHHWVWCVPIVLLLWLEARRWLVAAALFWTYAPFLLPTANRPERHYAMWQSVLSGWYVYFGLAFLALTAVRSARAGSSVEDEDIERARPVHTLDAA